jgi:peroxiredoxin
MKIRPLSALALVLAATALAHAAGPTVGQPAPDFTLPDAKGAAHSLSDYKGKIVVLEWFNPGCPFVRKHYGPGSMQKLQQQATKDGVVWLSIDSSAPGKQGHLEPSQAAETEKSLGMHSTALLLDPEGKVGRLYEARTTPEMFVINADGVLVYKGAIDDRPTPDPASLQDAKNYVAAALAALKSGQPVTPAETKSYGCSVKY